MGKALEERGAEGEESKGKWRRGKRSCTFCVVLANYRDEGKKMRV